MILAFRHELEKHQVQDVHPSFNSFWSFSFIWEEFLELVRDIFPDWIILSLNQAFLKQIFKFGIANETLDCFCVLFNCELSWKE